MRTRFAPGALGDPQFAASEAEIRRCVHCGFCLPTCPTYVLLGDELDSPRGRIALIQDMLETDRTPSGETVRHVDRCLSCLACVTACPSGVDYGRLVDHARAYIEARYRRPPAERMWRALLAWVLPHPARLRRALELARWARPLGWLMGRVKALRPGAAMLALAASSAPAQRGRGTASPQARGWRGRRAPFHPRLRPKGVWTLVA
jgi:glycolate oxidase iron-sulfur subunit